jgi:hypothetical protein
VAQHCIGRSRGSEPPSRWPLVAIGAGLAVVVLAAAVFVVWDRNWRRASSANPGTNCPTVVRAHRKPPFAAIGVHRVALIGDSIMFQPSCVIANALADVGAQTSRHAVPATGLLNGSIDWVRETGRILRDEHPDVVLAIFVGNYAPPYVRDGTGNAIQPDTPAFFRSWQARAKILSTEVRNAGAELYWISPPPIAISTLVHAQRLYDGYRTLTRDHFLDSGRVLAGASGKPLSTIDTCGAVHSVRSALDGVHLSTYGARIYGQQIAHDLTKGLGLLVAPRPC